MPLENPSIQTHLVLLCCIKRLCIFGPKGAIRICYDVDYYYYYVPLLHLCWLTPPGVEYWCPYCNNFITSQ